MICSNSRFWEGGNTKKKLQFQEIEEDAGEKKKPFEGQSNIF